jgi:hypothetical protein
MLDCPMPANAAASLIRGNVFVSPVGRISVQARPLGPHGLGRVPIASATREAWSAIRSSLVIGVTYGSLMKSTASFRCDAM